MLLRSINGLAQFKCEINVDIIGKWTKIMRTIPIDVVVEKANGTTFLAFRFSTSAKLNVFLLQNLRNVIEKWDVRINESCFEMLSFLNHRRHYLSFDRLEFDLCHLHRNHTWHFQIKTAHLCNCSRKKKLGEEWRSVVKQMRHISGVRKVTRKQLF